MAEIFRTRVVVAEDDEPILELIRTRLSIAGYDVSYARDGHGALEIIKAVKPAGLILDLNMPRLDGFGVLGALRTFKQRAAPPVLVLTARHSPEDVRRCLALGAKDYLAKPFDDRTLLTRVARLVRAAPHRQPPPTDDSLMI